MCVCVWGGGGGGMGLKRYTKLSVHVNLIFLQSFSFDINIMGNKIDTTYWKSLLRIFHQFNVYNIRNKLVKFFLYVDFTLDMCRKKK